MSDIIITATIFPVGCFVLLKNLTKKAELNGRIGEVVGKPRSNGRIPVKLDNNLDPMAVKPTNLQVETCSVGFPIKRATGSESFAGMLRGEGHYDEAIRFYEQALRLDENWTMAHLGIGLSHMQSGRWTEAEQALKTCVEKENCVDKCGAELAAHAYFNLSLCLEKRMGNMADILSTLDAQASAIRLQQLARDILKYRQIASAMDPQDQIYKDGLREWQEKLAVLFSPED